MIQKILKKIKDVLSPIIQRKDGYIDYLTEIEKKEEAKQKPYLEEKSDYLDEFSQDMRERREFSANLGKTQILELRKKEEKERLKANCRFSKKKWKRLRLQQQSKALCLKPQKEIYGQRLSASGPQKER